MKSLLIQIEKFMRWIAKMDYEDQRENAKEIDELANHFVSQLQPLIDRMPDDDEIDDDD